MSNSDFVETFQSNRLTFLEHAASMAKNNTSLEDLVFMKVIQAQKVQSGLLACSVHQRKSTPHLEEETPEERENPVIGSDWKT